MQHSDSGIVHVVFCMSPSTESLQATIWQPRLERPCGLPQHWQQTSSPPPRLTAHSSTCSCASNTLSSIRLPMRMHGGIAIAIFRVSFAVRQSFSGSKSKPRASSNCLLMGGRTMRNHRCTPCVGIYGAAPRHHTRMWTRRCSEQ